MHFCKDVIDVQTNATMIQQQSHLATLQQGTQNADMQYRNLGKKLIMDENTLQVPFFEGRMTDYTFISANGPAATPTGR